MLLGGKLLDPLKKTLDATLEMLNGPGHERFVTLEFQMDQLIRQVSESLQAAEIEVDDAIGLAWSEDVAVLVHFAVSFADFVDVLSLHLKDLGFVWGEHLLARSDFRHISFKRLADYAPDEQAAKLLLGGTAIALQAAVHEVARLSQAIPGWGNDVVKTLTTICARFGGGIQELRGHSSTVLLDRCEDEASAGIRIGTTVLQQRLEQDRVFHLTNWHGNRVFPKFQFEGPGFTELAEWLFDETNLRRDSWATCLWVAINGHEEISWFESRLAPLVRLKGNWNDVDAVRYYETIAADLLETVPAGSPYFRLTNSEHGPFHFACAPEDPEVSGGPGGRFDTAPGSDRGACYLAQSIAAVCQEVFGHSPGCSMGELLERHLWSLSPMQDLTEVRNLTDLDSEVTATPKRAATQGLASMIEQEVTASGKKQRAMKTPLRTEGARSHGLVLFGRPGVALPGAVGLGAWSTESTPAVQSKDVWSYVESRIDNPQFPFFLQRVPSDVSVVTVP